MWMQTHVPHGTRCSVLGGFHCPMIGRQSGHCWKYSLDYNHPWLRMIFFLKCGRSYSRWPDTSNEPWVNIVCQELVDFPTIFSPTNMAPYARWVKESFKQTLIDACNEYLNTNDRGNEKTRSKLITWVANEIGAIAKDKTEDVPDELEMVVPGNRKRHTSWLMLSNSPGCADLVWKLHGRTCQGNQAIKIKGRHLWSSDIVEDLDSKVGLRPFIFWPHFRQAERTVWWWREGYRQILHRIVNGVWRAQWWGSEALWGKSSGILSHYWMKYNASKTYLTDWPVLH